MFCNQCGKEIPENSKFCNFCGAKVGNNCPQCGTELPEGSKFCHICGTPLEASIPVAPVKKLSPVLQNSPPKNSRAKIPTIPVKKPFPILQNFLPKNRKQNKPPKIKLEETGWHHNLIGNQHYNDGDYEAAIDEYNEALKLVEFDALFTAGAVYLINRGNAYMKIGDRQNALWDYVAAHQLYNYVFAYFPGDDWKKQNNVFCVSVCLHGDDWQNDVFCFQKDELKEICTKSIDITELLKDIGRADFTYDGDY